MKIDARGVGCPEPVLMTKKGLAANPQGLEVLVDNNTAKENVKRFAANQGYQVEILNQDAEYLLKIKK